MAKSKFFRVFVEGFTASDGRKIEAAWIDDIVATVEGGDKPGQCNASDLLSVAV
jgi:hypothetical protein